jgi:predicted CoA-binding protein
MSLYRSNFGEFLTYRRIAVIGVSPDRQRFGNRIYFNLKSKGYEVYAVNPVYDRWRAIPAIRISAPCR